MRVRPRTGREVGGGQEHLGAGVRVDVLVEGGATAAGVLKAALAGALTAAACPLEADPGAVSGQFSG
ncbi:hypothetical protein [Streptomyces sp. 3N207]|uniref:hypothetical protein n=1 Tax=Streptomyces sp. 3N207 TaxID=3457417 RepID=UPI003FD1204D